MTLPCPFCGSKPRQARGVGRFWKQCTACDARGPDTSMGEDAACETWNERAYRQPIYDIIDADQAELTKAKARLADLRRDLAPLFHLCQWGHAVAGVPLQFKPDVAAAEQALISFLHETEVPRPPQRCHTGDHLLAECPGDHGK